MALFPSPDTPAYRAWSAAADIVIVNLLTLAGCLPLVSAGAALTACARTTGEMAAGEDPHVLRTWWRSFRANLRQSLAWWPPVAMLLALGAWEYRVLGSAGTDNATASAVSGLVLAGELLLVAVLIWLAPLTAFFEAPVRRHVANAVRLALGRLTHTATCLGIVCLPLLVLRLLPALRAEAAWFMVLLGPAFLAYLMALVQHGTIARLRGTSQTSHGRRPTS